MICAKCDKDLAQCECDDLPERLESIKKCEFLYIGPEYLARIEDQATKVRATRPHIEVKE